MRVLLISTYELGRQPVHLASPAGGLRRAGHEVRTLDLAVEEWSEQDVGWAERLAISVPMHTATRLADQVVSRVRHARPELPIALYGLYAAVGGAPVDARLEGEYEPGLLEWIERGTSGGRHVGRSAFAVPDRSSLAPLDGYSRLEHQGRTVLAGAVEASHGCRHRCRHCPIPAVYDGRLRVVGRDEVLADIDNLAAAGAAHVTFGDADFLNAPAHSLAVLEQAHRRHPEITFDATIKVEHILEHRHLWPRLGAANLLFVVSAFESVDEATLQILDKGHTVADMVEALAVVREVGVHIRPTWLPFFPWTTVSDVADVFEFLVTHDLGTATDPVQMAIRLLVPRGSLLEAHPSVSPHLSHYDDTALTWSWAFADEETALLHKQLEAIASEASDCGQEAIATLERMRQVVATESGRVIPPFVPGTATPRLSESWFCCAEPTHGQVLAIGPARHG